MLASVLSLQLALVVVLQGITKPMGQLVTALIGGGIEVLIVPILKIALRNEEN